VSYLALARKIIAEGGLAPPDECPQLLAAVAAEPSSEDDARVWIIAGGNGEMRLAVQAEPPWPQLVYRAAALVEVIDRHHRAGRDAPAAEAAVRLEEALTELRRNEVTAWLTS
jgi:hypothetical protein